MDNGQQAPFPGVDSGSLVFNLPLSYQWSYALYSVPNYKDVRVDALVDVTAGAGTDGAAGIVCRYQEDQGWYEFNIFSDQTYTLLFGQWLSPGVARYTPMYKGSSEKIQSGTNQIGLICQGDILTPFINQVQMRQYDARKVGLTQGEIGLSAASFADIPFRAAFDWVKVSLP